jgi:predicted Zn-dependent protease with MMP-like domain
VDDETALPEAIRRHLQRGWEALEGDDLGAALRALERARRAAPDHPDVLELAAECALAGGHPDEALEAYRRWSVAEPDDIEPHLGCAEVYLDEGDPRTAARLLEDLLKKRDLAPQLEADARHLLGIAYEERGDFKRMVAEWLAVLRLDASLDGGDTLISADRFQEIAEAALEELPEEVRSHLDNVPILMEDSPTEDMVRDGLDPRTLVGLFEGYAMPDQSVLGMSGLTLIQLFQRNLEREAADEDDLAEQIRITVLHETAHYFGADEDDLRRLGLD